MGTSRIQVLLCGVNFVVIILNEREEVLFQHRVNGSWGLPGGLMELGG